MIGEDRPRRPRTAAESSLGLAWMPFTIEAGAGSFVPSTTQHAAIRRIDTWWADAPAGSLAMITGTPGSGLSRTLIELRRQLDRRVATVRILDRPDARRSDVQLLRDAIVAFGGEPTGRTGLDLQASLREAVTTLAANGPRPLLVIDGGPLGGSQLEILRAVLATSPLGVVIAGQPDLAMRVTRRPSLQAALGATVAIDPFSDEEIATLVHRRLADAGGAGTLLDDAACDLVVQQAAGSPAAAIAIMRQAVRHATARGGSSIQAGDVSGTATPGPDITEEDELVAIQTRLTLPGIDDRRGQT